MPGVDFQKGMTTVKGDLLPRDVDTFTRLPIGTANQVLTVDLGEATSMKWATNVAGGPGLVLIACVTAASSATVVFTSGIDSTFDMYKLYFWNVEPTANGEELNIRFSNDGGVSYETSNYECRGTLISESGLSESTSTSQIHMTDDTIANTGVGILSGEAGLFGLPDAAKFSTVNASNMNRLNSGPKVLPGRGGGIYKVKETINAIELRMTSGNFLTGDFCLYGLTGT